MSTYIPNTDADRAELLAAVGATSIDDLFAELPGAYRRPRLHLPAPLSEPEVIAELRALAERNVDLTHYACFLGAGSYRHFVPSVVGHVISRSEFYTSYTPYQPEVSQGTLQTIYEFQSLICALTGMDAANAGHYDGATAFAEAALMAARVTGRERIGVQRDVHPEYLGVLKTYLSGRDLAIVPVDGPGEIPAALACVLIQQPNFFGEIEDVQEWADCAHAAGALLGAHVNPIALGMLAAPGQQGADMVTAEAQPLGQPPSFGGPYAGIFACRAEHVRQVPGRIAGLTADRDGRRGFVLTLQTREQHIRREKATSNICTNQALIALAATVYLSLLGKHGLRQVAEICYHRAHYLADRLNQIPRFAVATTRPFFNEFVVHCPIPPAELNRRLLAERIVGGLDLTLPPLGPDVPALRRGEGESSVFPSSLSAAERVWGARSLRSANAMLLCVTELNTRAEIDRLVEVLSRVEVAA